MGGAARGGSGNDGALLTEINVTPLVDVVLVLLILMMVTATSLAARTIPVELPKAKTALDNTDMTDKPFVVAVDQTGSLFIDDEKIDEPTLHARARSCSQKAGTTAAVLAADGRAQHAHVVRALEILRSERITKIAIVVRAREE